MFWLFSETKLRWMSTWTNGSWSDEERKVRRSRKYLQICRQVGRSLQSQSRRVPSPPTKVRRKCELLRNCHRKSVLVPFDWLSEVFGFVSPLHIKISHKAETIWKGDPKGRVIFVENEEGQSKILIWSEYSDERLDAILVQIWNVVPLRSHTLQTEDI